MGIRIRSEEPCAPARGVIIVSSIEEARTLQETFRGMATIEISQDETRGTINLIVTAGDESLLESIRKRAQGKPVIEIPKAATED